MNRVLNIIVGVIAVCIGLPLLIGVVASAFTAGSAPQQSQVPDSQPAPVAEAVPDKPDTTVTFTVSGHPPVTFKEIDKADLALTQRAYAIFLKRCTGFAKIAPLVNAIEVRDEEFDLSSEAKSRHWTIEVSVSVIFSDQTAHTMWELGFFVPKYNLFRLGGGLTPGIVSDDTSLHLCISGNGLSKAAAFMSAPQLSFLTKWPSDIAFEKAHPNLKLDSSTHPLSSSD